MSKIIVAGVLGCVLLLVMHCQAQDCRSADPSCHTCVMTAGGHTCNCDDGFIMTEDGKKCKENKWLGCYIDNPNDRVWKPEIRPQFRGLLTVQKCIYACQNSDYTYAGPINQDVCFCGNDHNLELHGRRPSAECSRPCPGNVDETCGANRRLEIYSVCPRGYYDSTSADCNQQCHCEDDHICSRLGTCPANCAQGWKGEQCQYRDCSYENGGCEQVCISQRRSNWCSCQAGYEVNPDDSLSCLDTDECSRGSAHCVHTCINTPGRYRCECHRGYKSHSVRWWLCNDIDECSHNMDDCELLCVNTLGSYRCECNPGYGVSNRNSHRCVDINECTNGQNQCEQLCINEIGSYTCDCEEGYGLSGRYICEDIIECDLNNGGCAQECFNTPGSYICSCAPGYKSTGVHDCEDVDECTVNNGGCETHCNNTVGSYQCYCDTGYILSPNDTSRCLDADECSDNNGGCSGICSNQPGAYSCQCNDGNSLVNGSKRFCENSALSGGAIGGIVIGAFMILLVPVVLLLIWYRNHKTKMDNCESIQLEEMNNVGAYEKTDAREIRPAPEYASIQHQGQDSEGVYEIIGNDGEIDCSENASSPQHDNPLDVTQDNNAPPTNEMLLTHLDVSELTFGPLLHQSSLFSIQKVDWNFPRASAKHLILKRLRDCDDELKKCGITYVSDQLKAAMSISDARNLLLPVALFIEDIAWPLYARSPRGSLKALLIDLADLVSSEYENQPVIWQYVVQASHGLHCLHSAKEDLLQYEMSAEHVIMVQEGSQLIAKLTGFASAAVVRERRKLEKKKKMWSMRWLAPEVILGEQQLKASDIWGFGVFMWEVTSFGDTPYAETREDQIAELMKSRPKLKKPIYCTNAMYRLMTKCCQPNPRDRPSTEHLVEFVELLD